MKRWKNVVGFKDGCIGILRKLGGQQEPLLVHKAQEPLLVQKAHYYSEVDENNDLCKKVWEIGNNKEGDDEVGRTLLEVQTWGRGSSGQLGGGIEETRYYPSHLLSMSVPSNFCHARMQGLVRKSDGGVELGISCGLFHSALLVDGKVYIWGKGDGGRLGLGHEETLYVPTLNTYLDNVQSIALGGLHSVALTKDGEVFTWGYGGFGALGHSTYHRELIPRKVIGSWNGKITYIATSGAHTAAVTESGELYTWGRDEGEGRLGLGSQGGPDEGASGKPLKVRALSVPVIASCCGGFFSLALTKDGQVWSWGGNENFELGRGTAKNDWRPRPIPALDGVNIVQISCGGYHSLVLTDDGKVYTWGHGGQGQLGLGSVKNEKVPRVVESLADENVVYVACGSMCSSAVTDSGKLYMWGKGRDTQLGVPGVLDIQAVPVLVDFLVDNEELGPPHVNAVAAGASHAMCLLSRSPA